MAELTVGYFYVIDIFDDRIAEQAGLGFHTWTDAERARGVIGVGDDCFIIEVIDGGIRFLDRNGIVVHVIRRRRTAQ